MALLTVRNLSGRLQSIIDGQLDDLTVRELLDDSLRQLTSTWDWSFGKVRGTITTTASKTSGSVNVTSGSTSLTGASTSFDTGDTGSFIRVGSYRYEVSATSGSTGMHITPAYAGSSNTAASYTLFKSYYSLTTNAAHIIAAAINWPLYEISEKELDLLDSQRQSTGEPLYYVYRGMDTSAYQQLEIYPAPDARYVIHYVAFSIDEIGTSNSKTIVLLNNVLLKAAAEQACMAVAAKKDDPGVSQKWVALADRYGRQWRENMVLLQQWDMNMRGDTTGEITRRVSSEAWAEHDYDSAFLLGYSRSA